MVNKPLVGKIHLIDQEFVSLSFAELFSILETQMSLLVYGKGAVRTDLHLLIASLEMFLLLCNKWMRSRRIDADGKLNIRKARRFAYAWHSDVTAFMSNEHSSRSWVDVPLFGGLKLTDPTDQAQIELAEWAVSKGYAPSLESIFQKLPPEKAAMLESKKKEWARDAEDNRRHLSNAWVTMPLLGRLRES